MVARFNVIWWLWVRCQPMVSAPASSPAALRRCRNAMTSSTVSRRVAVGLVFGRRDRGSNAASPSSRQRVMSFEIQPCETP